MIRLALVLVLLWPARALAVGSIARMAPLSGAHSGAGPMQMSSAVGDVLVGHSTGAALAAWHGFYAPGMSSRTQVEDPLPAGAPVAALNLYLGPMSPNPARSEAVIEFGNGRPDEIDLSVFDAGGRRVRTLHRGPHAAGVSRVIWDLTTDSRRAVPAGMYFVRLSGASSSRTGRMIVLR